MNPSRPPSHVSRLTSRNHLTLLCIQEYVR